MNTVTATETPADKPAYSVLYEQRTWRWTELCGIHVEFYPNGRGRAWWHWEHSYTLVVSLDWEVTATLQPGTEESSLPDTEARLLGKFEITIKLNREPRGAGPQNAINWLDSQYLSSAWKPKQFQITIEQGVFRLPCRALKEIEDLRATYDAGQLALHGYRTQGWSRWFRREEEDPSQRQLYSYRIIFDKSPFPPPEDWVQPFCLSTRDDYPETKVEFVAHKLPKSDEERPAMNQAWQREMVRVWEAQPPSKPAFQMAMRWKESQRRKTESAGERNLRISREILAGSLVRRAAEDQAMMEEDRRLVVAEEAREAIRTEAARVERNKKFE